MRDSAALRQAFETGSAVVIAGTGVSSALSGGAPTATWRGLIDAAMDEAERLTPDAATVAPLRGLLATATPDDADNLIWAATMASDRIKKVGDGAFKRWLADTVGALSVTDDRVARALAGLKCVLLTTNYDTLLESALGRATACWTNIAALQESIADRASSAIGHLHGVWTEPDSVILSHSDYHRILQSESTQALQRAVASIRTVVYVGFGSGLDDPNFGKLIEWQTRVFPPNGTQVEHYRLCREEEFDYVSRLAGPTNIRPVVYGENYEDLPAFIESLAPAASAPTTSAGIIRDVAAEAQRLFESQLIEDSILAETADAVTSLDQAVVPPTLLRMPYQQYAKALRSRDESDPEALEPIAAADEAKELGCVVITGSDESGLSTTIKLMALQAARECGGVAPLYVNFRDCQRGKRPLERQIALAARSAGLDVGLDGAVIQPFVLALDDFRGNTPKLSAYALEALKELPVEGLIVGCKDGFEDEVVEKLRDVGREPRLRYLRAMTKDDVRAMAVVIAPAAGETLARRAIAVIRAENLPNTPLSVGLLLAVLLRGHRVAQTASQTAILDEYVSSLLGRGDPHEDARYGVDEQTREALLAAFAESLVRNGSSGLPEIDAVAAFQEAITRFGWEESPIEQLHSFIERRVLRRSGDHIVFSRHSYLYLFAAKRAMASRTFRTLILDRPLFFASIIRDQAALERRNSELLERVLPLIEERPAVGGAGTSAFDEIDSVDDLEEDEEDEEVVDEGAGGAEGDGGLLAMKDHGLIDLHTDTPENLPAFPSDDPAALSGAMRMTKSLELVSAVLRDSDQIEELDLKRRALVESLTSWGYLVKALEADELFVEFVSDLAEQVWVDGKLDEDHYDHDEFVILMRRLFPSLFLIGGVNNFLASRKLLNMYRSAMRAGDFEESEVVEIGAVAFAYALHDRGWPTLVADVLKNTTKAWIVRRFLLTLWMDDYDNDRVHAEDADDLLELCVAVRTAADEHDSDASRVRAADRFRQSMKNRRLRIRGRSLSGPSVQRAIGSA